MNRVTGKRSYCPTLEHAPQTLEGEAAWQAALAPGVWRRAGLGGAITGLDMTEALARIPEADALDQDAVRGFLAAIEIGRLTGEHDARETNGKDSER